VAVHFGGAGVHQRGARAARELERVARAARSDVQRLQRQTRVVERRGGGSKIEDRVRRPLQRKRLADVVVEEGEPGMSAVALGTVPPPGEQVVDGDDLFAALEEAI